MARCQRPRCQPVTPKVHKFGRARITTHTSPLLFILDYVEAVARFRKQMTKSRSELDMSAKRGRQRRRFPRHRTDLSLTVTVLRQEGYSRLQGRCHEIAEAGLGG